MFNQRLERNYFITSDQKVPFHHQTSHASCTSSPLPPLMDLQSGWHLYREWSFPKVFQGNNLALCKAASFLCIWSLWQWEMWFCLFSTPSCIHWDLLILLEFGSWWICFCSSLAQFSMSLFSNLKQQRYEEGCYLLLLQQPKFSLQTMWTSVVVIMQYPWVNVRVCKKILIITISFLGGSFLWRGWNWRKKKVED